jgi:hypothetical protein
VGIPGRDAEVWQVPEPEPFVIPKRVEEPTPEREPEPTPSLPEPEREREPVHA